MKRIVIAVAAVAATLWACVPDQSCSNPPHIRRTTSAGASVLGATRQNPIELGDVGSYGVWDLQIIDFSQTADLVQVRLAAEHTGTERGSSADVNDLKFCLAGSMHTLYLDSTDQYSDEGPSPVFGKGYGAEQVRNGWLTFENVAEGDDDFVLAVREASSILSRDADFLYLELESGANIVRDRSEVQRPTDTGIDLEDPVSLGEEAVTSAFRIEIVESHLGSEAERLLSSTSLFNPDPRPGKKFFLFELRVTNVARGNSPASISSSQFSADGFSQTVAALIAGTAGSGSGGSDVTKGVAANPFLELPGEKLEVTLYQGGSFDGWILLEVDEETVPLVVYDPKFGTGIRPDEDRRYFSLTSEPAADNDEDDGEDDSSSSSVTPAASNSASSPTQRNT